jgi:hypothetical protein
MAVVHRVQKHFTPCSARAAGRGRPLTQLIDVAWMIEELRIGSSPSLGAAISERVLRRSTPLLPLGDQHLDAVQDRSSWVERGVRSAPRLRSPSSSNSPD